MRHLVPASLLQARLRRHGSSFGSHALLLTIVFRRTDGRGTRYIGRLGLMTLLTNTKPIHLIGVLKPNLLFVCTCVEIQRVSDNVFSLILKRSKAI